MNVLTYKEAQMQVETGTTIKSGYIVDIQSWENDADNYANIVTSGLTKDQADFLVELARGFVSVNGSYTNRGARGFGNEDFSSEVADFVLAEIAKLVGEEKQSVLERFGLTDIQDRYDILNFLQEYILSSPVEYDYDFCRVVESITVKLLAEDVVIPEVKTELISEETL